MILKQILEYGKENGIWKALPWIIKKSLNKTISIFYQAIDFKVAVISLDRVAIDKEEYNSNYTCKPFQRKALLAIEKKFGKALAQQFAKRTEESRGFLIFCGDEIAGYGWASHNLLKNEGTSPFLIDIQPKRETIYFYDDFVTPDNRNKGAYTRLMTYRFFDAKKSGFKAGFLLFDKQNLPMASVTSKLGFRIVGQIKYRRYLWHVVKDTSALERVCQSSCISGLKTSYLCKNTKKNQAKDRLLL